ncbi:MAG: Bug family tripartite tricarboxylate transporter substrate binding protein [Rhodospirillaceae bacterium]
MTPFAPGGATDFFSRLLARHLQASLQQGVVVDNRGGAGGLLGTELAARADPDGYTLLFTTNSTTTIGPNLYKKAPYDPLKDLTPINKVVQVVGLLVAHPRVKAGNVSELIALANAQSAPLTYASSGTGAIGHLAGELFQAKTGVRLTHIPYKGGAPSITGLIGGEADLSFAQFPTVISHIKAGRLKLLAVTSHKRTRLLPDVPTVAEGGVPGYAADGWQGLFGPAGLPRQIVARLDGEVRKILQSADFNQTLSVQGAEPDFLGPKEFRDYLRSDFGQWKQLIDRNRISID